MQKLQYTVKSSYGRQYKYLTDEHLAKILEVVSGKKTITDNDILELQERGIQCEEVKE